MTDFDFGQVRFRVNPILELKQICSYRGINVPGLSSLHASRRPFSRHLQSASVRASFIGKQLMSDELGGNVSLKLADRALGARGINYRRV